MGTRQRDMEALEGILARARACRHCVQLFGHDPRPVLRAKTSARLLIIGQAPGTRVHETGIPWNDPSGDRLRQWLDIGRDSFYDEETVAIVPMGLCYPGRDRHGGDLPPPVDCAERWQGPVRRALPKIRLTLLVGSYAQKYYLGNQGRKTMGETVRAWRDYAPGFMPLPHPSWRNTAWLRKNPWFEADLLPELRKQVRAVLE